MSTRGPAPKSAELRLLEGERAHRPLPAVKPKYAVGVPDRPKGMSIAERRLWDVYVSQLGGTLRLVDGIALRRLCEAAAEHEELRSGLQKKLSEMKREGAADTERLKTVDDLIVAAKQGAASESELRQLEDERSDLQSRRLSGGARVFLMSTTEGRRVTGRISQLSSEIGRLELQFGLTPASAGRVESGAGTAMPMPPGAMDSIEATLCG